ncbi:hypothetical protein ACFQL4_03985 [Halosimplex aquaticum]
MAHRADAATFEGAGDLDTEGSTVLVGCPDSDWPASSPSNTSPTNSGWSTAGTSPPGSSHTSRPTPRDGSASPSGCTATGT